MIKDITLTFLILFIVVLLWYLHQRSPNGVMVKSQTDNRYYLVEDLPDKQEVADVIGRININNQTLIKHLKSLPNRSDYERLIRKYPDVVLEENVSDPSYTSYSLNKGELIALCARSKKTGKIHDINLLTYVMLHELAHILNETYGHGEDFRKCFSDLLREGSACGVYQPIDFSKSEIEYCGITIKG